MIAVKENTTATNSMAFENNMVAAVCVESPRTVAESSNEDAGSVIIYDMPPQGYVVGDIVCVELPSDEE